MSDFDTSFDAANTSIGSREDPNSSFSLGDAELPPSSDDRDAFSPSPTSEHASEAGHDDDTHDGPTYQFSWRANLKKIDDDDYDLEAISAASAARNYSVDDQATRLATASDPDKEMTDTFGGSLSPLTNPQLASSSARRDDSPFSHIENREAPSTPQTSSPSRHAISTPKSRSSPTPPTSIEQAQMPPGKGKGKAKGKVTVKPLRFDSDDQSANESKPARTENARTQRRKSATTSRVKALTKKENSDMQKVTARIKADKTVSIPRAPVPKYSITQIQNRFKPVASRGTSPVPWASDPIQGFSSDPPTGHDTHNGRGSFSQAGKVAPIPTDSDSAHDDDQFPSFSKLIQKETEQEHDRVDRLQSLREVKRKAIQHQQSVRDEDEDSELEIVDNDMQSAARDEAQARHDMAARGERLPRGRTKQLTLAGLSGRRERGSILPKDGASAQRFLKGAAASFPSSGKTRDEPSLTTEQLSVLLRHRASEHAANVRREKEEDWKRRGGKIKEQPAETASAKNVPDNCLNILKSGRAGRAQKSEDADVNDLHDGDSDQEWKPNEQGSDADVDGEGERSDDEAGEASHTRLDGDDQADDENESDNPLDVPRLRRNARRPIVVESDEEHVEDCLSLQISRNRVLVHDSTFARSAPLLDGGAEDRSLLDRNSHSSLGEQTDGARTEDGTDKENDSRLSFDRGEDKENTVIAFQSPVAGISLLASRGLGSLFGAEIQASPSGSVGRSAADGVRSPLKDLPADDEEDPFAFTPIPALRLGLDGGGSLEASPVNLGGSSSLQLQPAFSLRGKDRTHSVSPSPLGEPLQLGGGLGGGGFSQFFTQEGNARNFDQLKAAQDNEDISLTLDAGLQPALDVSRTFRQKADEMFGREQELIALEEQSNAAKVVAPEMFVDANGFLTQTRPQFISPLRTRSPSQLTTSVQLSSPGNTLASLSSARKPLASLDLDDDRLPRRRLMRRSPSPFPDVPKPKNAFEVLGKQHASSKAKSKKPFRSEFVEGEAEESDDDAGFGFGAKRRQNDEDEDEDEEDGDDQDEPLADLVDDHEMDEQTLGKDAVMEKVREHIEQDDRENEKHTRDVIQGKYRLKRGKHGVDISGDESTDDEDASKVRPRAKRSRRDNDDITALKKDPNTRAFAEAYREADDEEDEFASLHKDDMNVDQEEDEPAREEERETVSADQLREQLRQAARTSTVIEEFNPHDVSYVDDDDDDMELEFGVREISSEARASRLHAGEAIQPKKVIEIGDADRLRMAQWARSETSSRTGGVAGRNAGGSAAVTGHAKLRSGNESFKAARGTGSSSGTAAKGTKIGKGSSLLLAVPSRRGKFGS